MTLRQLCPISCAAAMLAFTGQVQAATIAIGATHLPGFSTGVIGPVLTPSPNNDNATSVSPNTITYGQIFFNTWGPAEVEFNATASGGTTEYRVRQNLIVNNTGSPWGGFLFELGFGTGSAFVRSTGLDQLTFDTPQRDPAPFSSRFPQLSHEPEALVWTGARIPSVGVTVFEFVIDVPDGIDSFTLRQTPLAPVPEPGTAMLLTAALGSLAALRRKRATMLECDAERSSARQRRSV